MAAKRISSLSVLLGASTAPFSKAFAGAGNIVSGFGSKIGGLLATGAKLTGIGTAIGGAFATIGGIGSKGVSLAAELEQTQVAFSTLLGSADAAKQMMDDITAFAASTPFEFPELAESAKKLIAFGVSAGNVMPALQSIGDIAAGVGAPISELAELYGKARVQGTLYAEDINQMVGRGIPVIQEFAKQLGVSEGQVKKLASEGKIGFSDLQQAFTDLSSQGGKFSGMMDAQSRTLSGLWSTLQDGIGMSLAKTAQALIDAFDVKSIMQGAIGWIDGLGKKLVSFVTQWGPIAANAFRMVGDIAQRLWSRTVDGIAWVADNLARGYNALVGWVPGFDSMRQSAANFFGQIGDWIGGLVNALRSGKIGLAADIALGGLYVAFLKVKAEVILLWDSLWAGMAKVVEGFANKVLSMWNAVTGQLASALTDFFIDDEEQLARFEKFSDAIKKQYAELAQARKDGDSQRVGWIEKRLADMKRAQMQEDPRAARAAASKMAQQMTQDVQIKIDDGSFLWGKNLADQAGADYAARMDELKAAQSKLATNLTSAGEAAKAYDAGVASAKPPDFAPFARAGEMVSQFADAAERAAVSLGLIVAGSAESQQMQAQAAWDARIATDTPQIVNPRGTGVMREIAKEKQTDSKMTQVLGTKMDSLFGAFKIGQVEVKEVSF